MKTRLLGLALAATWAAGCAPHLYPITTNPKLISGECGIHKVAVLPPRLAISRATVKGIEESFEMERDFAQIFQEVIAELLPAYGFETVASGLSKDQLQQESEIKFELARLQQAFAGLRLQLLGTGQVRDERIEKGELTLSEDVIPFAEGCGAEALALSAGWGRVHSVGKQMLGAAAGAVVGVSVVYYNVLFYRVGLVDGRDGKVMMVFNGRVALDDFVTQESQPGGKKYAAKLPDLREAVRDSLTEQLTEALKREPAPAPAAQPPPPAHTS